MDSTLPPVPVPRRLGKTDVTRVTTAVAMLFGLKVSDSSSVPTSGVPEWALPDYRRLENGRISWRCVNAERVQHFYLERFCKIGIFLMYDTTGDKRLIVGRLKEDVTFEAVLQEMMKG